MGPRAGAADGLRAGAARGALFGVLVGLVGLPIFPPSSGGNLALLLWLVRLPVGAAIGGALAGALVGRLLPAMRDGVAAVIVGVVAVGLFVATLQLVLYDVGGWTPARALLLTGLTIILGSAIGLFTRAVVLHGEPQDEAAHSGRHVLIWRIMDALRPRRRAWSGRKRRRRERLRAQPFPESWRRHLERNVPYYGMLPPADREELEKQIQVFIAEKNFEGCGGLELTDEIKVTIAAQACMLTLHLDADYYPKLLSILVYPSTFVPVRPSLRPYWQDSGSETVPTLGESWTSGIVVLSWNSVLGGAANVDDGHNVVFHEFAHQLDQETGEADGVPILGARSSYRTWARVLQEHFDAHAAAAEKGARTVLDHYGATNAAEFFAVATEAFFEKPAQMKARHPELYEELRKYYGQDPAGWIGRPGSLQRR